MKKILLTLTLVTLLIASASTAFAAGGPPVVVQGRSPFALVGKITAIDGGTVTVQVMSGNRLVKAQIGKELAFQTTAGTHFLTKAENGVAYPITLEDLAVGQKVSVNGKVSDGVWTATRITVGAKLVHLP